jgi:hypothetical protein
VYNFLAFDPQLGFEVPMLEQTSSRPSVFARRRIGLVLLAVSCLTISLAARFTVLGAQVQRVNTAKSQSAEGKKQSILTHAFTWIAPSSAFILFQPPQSSRFVLSTGVQTRNLILEIWRYNRPPPSC